MVKVISLNIEGKNHLVERVLPFLEKEKPDVLCLQEVRQVDVPQIEAAAGVTGRFVPMADVNQPTWFINEAQGMVGLYIGSNLAEVEIGHQAYQGREDVIPSPDPDHPDHNFWNRYLLWLSGKAADKNYTFATTHFTYAKDGGVNDLQRQHLQKIFEMTAQLPPHILIGDFNAPRGGEIFDRLSQAYQDNIPPEVKTTLDPHLHRSGVITFVVDGLFSQPEYEVKNVRVVPGVSDHMAVVGEIERIV